MSSAAPPGWYRDPWGQSAQRFWDGVQWTPHVSPWGAPMSARLPDGAPIYGPSIWLLALLPLLTAVAIWFIHVDTSVLDDYASGGDAPILNPFAIYGPGYATAALLGVALQATLIVLAYRDRQHLTRVGVLRPFHWAWVFLGSIVYVIGRSVVVRKVAAPRGLAPMWAAIAVSAVAMVSSTFWVVFFIATMVQHLPAATG